MIVEILWLIMFFWIMLSGDSPYMVLAIETIASSDCINKPNHIYIDIL